MTRLGEAIPDEVLQEALTLHFRPDRLASPKNSFR
jgi:hypothetical protein